MTNHDFKITHGPSRESSSHRVPVLVVDDERTWRAALSRELRGEYDVIVLPGIEEALEIMGRRGDFVAVISDLVMRGPSDGCALLEAIRLLVPRCAGVLVSSTLEGEWFVKKLWDSGSVLAVSENWRGRPLPQQIADWSALPSELMKPSGNQFGSSPRRRT